MIFGVCGRGGGVGGFAIVCVDLCFCKFSLVCVSLVVWGLASIEEDWPRLS